MRAQARLSCRPIVTQFLCRDTRPSKGTLSQQGNLYRDPSHQIPTPNPISTPKFFRDTGPSNLCRNRGAMVVCRDKDFLSLIRPNTRTRSCASTCAHRAHCCVRRTPVVVLVHAIAPPCRDTENPIATQGPRNPIGTDFLCHDRGLKMGSSSFWPPALPVPIFFSFSFPFQSTPNST